MKWHVKSVVVLAIVSMFCVGQVQAVVIADSFNDYSNIQGQNDWYYGYYDGTLTAETFKLLPNYDGTGIQNNVTLGWSLQLGAGGYWTTVHELGGHPNGTNGNQSRLPVEQWAARRWVSDVSGPITISGIIAPINGGNMYTHIFIDGTEIFQHQVPNGEFNYDLTASVNVGSNVDFVISPNNHNDVNGDTKFTAIISSPVPEPSTFALLCIALVGIFGGKWRRSRVSVGSSG